MSGKRKNVEATIQKQLVLWIKKECPSGIEIRYNKNENKKNVLQAIDDQRMGQAIAGTPDLTLFLSHNSITYILELELKKKDGKLNAAQKIWHADFKPTTNRQAEIAYGFEEAKLIINNWIEEI